MPEPTLELLVAQVEMALEEGDISTARRMLAEGEALFGAQPEVISLRRRVAESAELARPPEVEALVQRAQSAIRAAEYSAALAPLQQALGISPDDARIRTLLDQTSRAAERHSAAVERQQATVRATREIRRLLAEGELVAARQKLQDARTRLGRQNRLDELAGQIEEAFERDNGDRAQEHAAQARDRLEVGDLQGALHQVEQSLALADGAETRELKERIQGLLGESEGRRRRRSALKAAAHDVERLIGAKELVRADRRLRQAVDELGDEPVFRQLSARIDDSKKDKDLRNRVEWAERRSREAEALREEAAELTSTGDLASAVGLLEKSRQLDPSHPEIDSRLDLARQALERQRQEQARLDEHRQAESGIRGHLDALRLTAAQEALQQAEAEFPDSDRFAPLRVRLEGLRAAESETEVLPDPRDLDRLGIAARSAIVQRQRSVASAYAWKQAWLYPLRGEGPIWLGLFFALSLSFLLLDQGLLLSTWGLDRWIFFPLLMPLLGTWSTPILARATLIGGNQPPPIRQLFSLGKETGNALTTLAGLALFGLPLWLLLATRPWHPLLEPSSGPLGWMLLALLAWGACALAAPAGAVLAAFGRGPSLRFDLHVDALRLGSGSLFASNLLFLGLALLVVLRVAFVSDLPFLAGPLVALLEAYGLVLLPHLMALPLRTRRLEWAEIYA